jgi:hypothetical protein
VKQYSELIQKLWNCTLACEACAAACLNEEDIARMRACIKLDRDCADICNQAVRLLQRESAMAKQFLLLCEEICQLCADECGKHEHDHCQRCAAACRDCAAACHENHEAILQA